MPFTQEELVRAFLDYTQTAIGDCTVGFSKRGNSPRSYVNVFGPSHCRDDARNARICIEYDGSISFKDESVAKAMHAQPRLQGDTFPGTGAACWN